MVVLLYYITALSPYGSQYAHYQCSSSKLAYGALKVLRIASVEVDPELLSFLLFVQPGGRSLKMFKSQGAAETAHVSVEAEYIAGGRDISHKMLSVQSSH